MRKSLCDGQHHNKRKKFQMRRVGLSVRSTELQYRGAGMTGYDGMVAIGRDTAPLALQSCSTEEPV